MFVTSPYQYAARIRNDIITNAGTCLRMLAADPPDAQTPYLGIDRHDRPIDRRSCECSNHRVRPAAGL